MRFFVVLLSYKLNEFKVMRGGYFWPPRF